MEFSTESGDELYSPETCRCPKCNRVLKSEKVLRDHQRYCTRKIYLQCEHCPFVTKYKANLKVHVSTMHLETKSIDEECPNCTKKYKNQRSLRMHLRICEKPCLFQCYDCTKSFRSKSNLNNHISRMHLKVSVDGEIIGENRYFQCNDCSYKSKHKDDFKKHVIKHCGDIRASCEKCGRTYKNQGYLKKHSKFCQIRSLGCYRCSFKTHEKSILSKHFYEMHLKSSRFGCADCGKTYKRKEEIVNHIKRNCGKEPHFMCEYCPFRTMYRPSLKKHRTNLHRV